MRSTYFIIKIPIAMLLYNYLDFHTFKIKKRVFSLAIILGLILSFLLQVSHVDAKTTSTTNNGDWKTSINWDNGVPGSGDVANVNNVMTFTDNLSITSGGIYNFNAGSSGSICTFALSMDNGSTLNIYGNVSFKGTPNLNGGTIHVYNGATLTFPGTNEAKANIIVDARATMIIDGNLLNNHGNIQVDGLIQVLQNYDGQASDAIVTGNGNITSVGHMSGINNSSIFGYPNPYCPSNCDGLNLFGGGNCGRTVTSSASSSSVCAGGTVTLTSSLSGSTTSYPYLYQWQLKNSSNVFVNISGATSAIYSPVLTETNTFRIAIGYKQNLNDSYCYTFGRPDLTVSVSACPRIWVGGTSSDWNMASNWNPAIVPTKIDDVTIPNITSPKVKPVIAAGATGYAKAVTIDAGSSLTLISTATLNAYGSVTNNGTFTVSPTSTVALLGTSTQTLAGVTTLYNATVNNASGGVEIASGASNAITLKGKLSLTSGAFTTNGNLSVDIDNGGNIGYASGDAGSVSGNVTVFRAINSITTHYISCPLNGVTANDLADDAQVINPGNNNSRLFQFNNAAYKWVGVTDLNSTLSPSSAYSMWFPATTSVDFTGTYTHNASYSYTGLNVASRFMFVSNPYPSTLDWDAASGWTKSGVNNAVYFWNPITNSYTSYVNGQGTNSATKYIPAMNSFFVAYNGTTPSTATVIMDGRVRTSTFQSMWRTASDETVRLTLKSSIASDETLIRFNEDATNDFDGELDAFKMMNPSSVPSIYTTFGSTKYSINSISSPYAKDTIQVFTKIPADGDYVLSIASSDPTTEYVLVDKKLGTETVVSTRDYLFSALETDSLNRFELQLRQTTTTGIKNGTGTSGVTILSSPNGFLVKSNVTGNGTIEILDVTGKLVKILSNVSLSNGNNFFTPEIAGGLYLIKVNIDNTSYIDQVSIIK